MRVLFALLVSLLLEAPHPSTHFPARDPQGTYALERAFPHLRFDKPVFLTSAHDGSNHLYVVERSGRIRSFANDDAVAEATTFLDLSAVVSSGNWEEGLLGLAFSPDYATSREFFVCFTTMRGGSLRVVVERFQAGDARGEVVLEVDKPTSEHSGGMLAFGPDGMLYVGFGDGGGDDDPFHNAQNRTTLLGKILRLDPRGGRPYAVPRDNPFVGAADGSRPEIWAYGLRNPWRFSFDASSGALWAGDVGQESREEVDVIVRGGNYGWPYYEGTRRNREDPFPAGETPLPPITEYGRETGWSVIGGYVYRGARAPSLRGRYVFGDFGVLPTPQPIWALRFDPVNHLAVERTRIASFVKLTSFGEDDAGELYAMSLGTGEIHRLVETNARPAQDAPALLSQTGLFSDMRRLTPESVVVPYDVRVPLWSDGAVKQRWHVAPPNAAAAEDVGVGSLLVKHFARDGRPLETRVLVHQEDGWRGYSYAWNDAGDDAQLLTDGETRADWIFPSRSQCLSCHTEAAGYVLGFTPHQRTLSPLGDASASLESRARSYLDVNCSICHRPGGVPQTTLDLRFETPLASAGLVDVPPLRGNLGVDGAVLVKPGSKERSILWQRLRRRGDAQMPPLATQQLDPEAVDVVGQWLDGLAAPTRPSR